ncbi:hypothetical protein QQG55_25750 [Brugia pahangi]
MEFSLRCVAVAISRTAIITITIPGMPELRESERRKRDLSTLIFKEKKKFDAYVVIAKENSKKKQLE